jgi:glutathione S-transferase
MVLIRPKPDARERDHMTYTLWGSAHSLYTGKIRSYLIKKRIAFVERYPSDPDFAARVLPSVGMMVIPVLETPDGTILQDSGEMIDWLEAHQDGPQLEPLCPVQQTVSLLIDAFGSENLLPLAMHYRWTYRAEQEQFLRAEFGRTMAAGMSRTERREAAARTMAFFNGFLPNLGVTEAVVPALEAAWFDLIELLDEHFQHHPYLLGGRPCRADFGMMAPMFAHLGRDPVPAQIMKLRAPNLYRWTERMNSALITDGEYPGYGDEYAPAGTVPDSLLPVLRLIAADWLPGLVADAACFNDWAADKPAGTIVSRKGERQVHPNVGRVSFDWRGTVMQRGSQPHMLWMLAKAQAKAASLAADAADRLGGVMAAVEGQALLDLPISRTIARRDNVLVLT